MQVSLKLTVIMNFEHIFLLCKSRHLQVNVMFFFKRSYIAQGQLRTLNHSHFIEQNIHKCNFDLYSCMHIN